MFYLKIFIIGLLLSGCGNSDDKPGIIVPIYSNCRGPLDRFLSVIKQEGVNFSLTEFDYVSEAHPSSIGFITFTDSTHESVSSYAMTVKGICEPQGVIEFSNTVRGQELLFDELQRELDKGHGSVHMVVTKESLKYFFNERYSDWWKE